MDTQKRPRCQSKVDQITDISAISQVKLPPPKQNVDEARILYLALGGGVQCFQIFGDTPEAKRKNKPEHRHGTFDELLPWLIASNNAGCGIFIVINQTDGQGREIENITAVRSVFPDMDGSPIEPVLQVKPKPHIITETSPGHFHPLWLVHDCPLERFKLIQTAIAQRFDCDDKVGDLPRVLRMPGFIHWKDGPVLSKLFQHNDGPPYSIHEVEAGLKLTIPNPNSQEAIRDENTRSISSSSVLWAVDNNQIGDADLFMKLMNGRFCYDHKNQKWFEWNGQHWIEDKIGQINTSLGEVIDIYESESQRQAKIRSKATREGKKDEADKAEKYQRLCLERIGKLQSVRRTKDVLWFAGQGEESLGITGEEWDLLPLLLPVKNGVVNLKDGSFRPGQQADFIKTVAPTEWQGINAPCPTWEKFLKEIIVNEKYESDPDTLDYLHRLLGYSISGLGIEHTFPILYGAHGRNGKGTMLETLGEVLGDITQKIPQQTLIQSNKTESGGSARADIVSIKGKRLVWASETDQGKRLSVGALKELVGGDTISARGLYEGQGKFKCTYTIFLLTNNKPAVPARAVDPIWERISLIPFHLKYVDKPNEQVGYEREKDIYLQSRLLQEAPGILAWLVRGFIKWRKDGLKKSARVQNATSAYQKDEDVLGHFLNECCDLSESNAKVKAGVLHKEYTRWCDERNMRPLNLRNFGDAIALILKKEESNYVYYLGCQLIQDQRHDPKH